MRKLEIGILAAGLVGAVLAGMIAYRLVGPYGDGPFGAGFRRIPDPATGGSILVHEFELGAAAVRAVVEERTGRVVELQLSRDVDGAPPTRALLDEDGRVRLGRDLDGDGAIDRWEYYADVGQLERQQIEKVGFSLAGDQVVDAWAFHDDDGRVKRVEVSTNRDGIIDRWEHYENGLMLRVEADTDGDNRIDSWSTYVDGILSTTASDEDRDGRPDRVETLGGNP